ncbi:protease [Bacillus luteolus]|uniref:Protease n=1 Tax=Litchfieldia luteola TaxID=682179 RepID=A0ABR9QDI9_9BACI|nr:transglutaminaseTgpA domain-containing protein [Cytobacillus luteolus]MBE4906560.1 protease [Cytobacillus luteolus]MBP1944606.1 transglutaminase-like putative cysteine protease [Cytobacillus luteolus]
MTLLKDRMAKDRSLLVHVFGFLLLWEWLRPLTQVTDTENVYIFIVFIGVCFLLNYLRTRLLVSSSLKLFIMVFMIHMLFYEGLFIDIEWVKLFISEIMYNVSLLLNANWLEITPAFRTLLFFVLLWLMSYLMFYWIILQKRIFLFLMLTIIYITVLDTFSPYDAKFAIVRTIIIGFSMLGILYIERIRDKEGIQKGSKYIAKWVIPLVVFIGCSTTIGYFAPKAAPQWPDPVPYLTGYGKGNGTGVGIKKIGYGTNDTQLGGPFIGDNTLVFTAEASKRQYWRVETKDEYTGKGWEASYSTERTAFNQENTVLNWYEEKTGFELAEANIDLNIKYHHIIYPLELLSVETDPDIIFSVNPSTEKIHTLKGDESISAEEYSVTYNHPQFPVEELREEKEVIGVSEGLEKADGFLDRYTQLPKDLPERVRELAVEITEDKTNRYEKVRAVETYFKANNFIYDTQNVAVPSKDQDYVDQFLFETKMGYCDNFSTSMIVLLRSIGIPARWVKGYSDGEYVRNTDEGLRVYEVTNNNAHSWVEVYFPGYGWIPFEPTKGFSNPSEFVYDLSSAGNNSTPNTTPELEKPDQPELGLEEEQSDGYSPSEKSWFENIEIDFSEISWKKVLFITSVLLLAAFILYKTRGKWYPFLAILMYKYRKNDKVYFLAYNSLLRQLDQFGLKRKEGQTLRDYAIYVDKYFSTNDMRNLTLSYEKALYRSDSAKDEWVKSVELWENLIKKTSS